MARIHIFGASGSGTTTLGESLSEVLKCKHYDTDDFFWEPTKPPFQKPSVKDDRIDLMRPKLEEIIPGGSMEEGHRAFMKWASEYDDGDMNMRSRIRHEEWIKTLPCDVIRFEGDISVEDKVREVLAHLKNVHVVNTRNVSRNPY